MTCATCALKIETKLKDLDGVSSSVVNFANEEATVEYDSGKIGYNEFNKAIKDLGYKANLAKIDVKLNVFLPEGEFNNFIERVKAIEGIYDVRGNVSVSKLFIEFNESKIDEGQIYSEIRKLGYTVEKVAGTIDKEIEAT